VVVGVEHREGKLARRHDDLLKRLGFSLDGNDVTISV
jgi:hypothetical protein